jgi:hypothetical protein
MKTEGVQIFTGINRSSLLERKQDVSVKSQELSIEEEKMISTKFNRKTTSLEFYENSGSVRKEQPAARGSNIDLRI